MVEIKVTELLNLFHTYDTELPTADKVAKCAHCSAACVKTSCESSTTAVWSV